MQIERILEATLRQRLTTIQAVALIGPRQCGKTTLAKLLGGHYFDLEQDGDWLALDLEWEARVNSTGLVVLDEAQSRPELFPRLRGAIDKAPGLNGRFLLLGSVSPALMRQVSESLAGRLALLELTPLLLSEIGTARLEDVWLFGGYPRGGLLSGETNLGAWGTDYLSLLAQRDLPIWGLTARPPTTERLLAMTAALHGQQWNASQVGQSLGLSHTTIGNYMDFLEGAFLLRTLRPWQANVRKRLVKRPKVYWRDSGLLHAILGVRTREQLLRQPWCGASWEGFCIEQIVAGCVARGRAPRPWFFRTSDGYELDLLVELDGLRWAFEFKLSSQVNRDDVDRLRKAASLAGADEAVLISRSDQSHAEAGLRVTNLPAFLQQWMS